MRFWAILISLLNIFALFSIPFSIIIFILSRAISKDLISVSSSEIQIDALAFISAVQSVKVKAWSAMRVPICTSITRP